MARPWRLQRRLIRNGELKSDWQLVVSRKGLYQKVPPSVRVTFDQWVRNHYMTIHSPLKRDCVRVPDPSNPKLHIKKNKLLLQCSIRELHRDLYDPEIGLGDLVRDKNGKPLISDTMMRVLLPPELHMLTNIMYKECCCCELCTLMSYLQGALNRFRKTFVALLEKRLKELKESTLKLT